MLTITAKNIQKQNRLNILWRIFSREEEKSIINMTWWCLLVDREKNTKNKKKLRWKRLKECKEELDWNNIMKANCIRDCNKSNIRDKNKNNLKNGWKHINVNVHCRSKGNNSTVWKFLFLNFNNVTKS